MDNSSNFFDIKQFLKQQKLHYHAQIRAEKLAAIMAVKRTIFIDKICEKSNISSLLSLFLQSINHQLLEEILKHLKPINNYIYDCSKDEISIIYRQISENSQLTSILDILKKNDDNFALINEISMLFVNFSALLEEIQDIQNFFDSISSELVDLFQETHFLEMKNNIIIIMGNLILKDSEIEDKILNKLGFLEGVLEIVRKEKHELKEIFFNTLAWFLDIVLDIPPKIQCFIKTISLILSESGTISGFSNAFQLKFLTKIFENCAENEIYELFMTSEPLISNFILSFVVYDSSNAQERIAFLSLLINISSYVEIIPYLFKMNIEEFIYKTLSSSPFDHQLKLLDLILNLFCHSSQTIKDLLPRLKSEMFSLVFMESNEEISKKALQALNVCLICGDEEICFELLTKELFEKILKEMESTDVDHAILMLKGVEKILFYGQILVGCDEQNMFFEAFCEMKGEEILEKLTEHKSKTISFLALHIIDTYF